MRLSNYREKNGFFLFFLCVSTKLSMVGANAFSQSEASTLHCTELNYNLPSPQLPQDYHLTLLGHTVLYQSTNTLQINLERSLELWKANGICMRRYIIK